MKIASVIKPRSGKPRTVTIHDRPYVFAPVQDKDDLTHYVAEVKNEDHAAILLGTGDFYAYGENLQPKPQLKPVAPNTVDLANKVAAEIFSDDVNAEATNLLNLAVAKMSVEVGKVSAPGVIRAALAVEKAKPDARASAVDLLQKTLDGITAAGVKG